LFPLGGKLLTVPTGCASSGVIQQTRGNQTQAARWFGISRITMKAKLVQCLCGQRLQRGRKEATSRKPDGKTPGESKSSPREIQNYLGRISGPLLDRIDLHVEVPAMKFRGIAGDRTGETSAQIRARVVQARKRQQTRFAHKRKITCNALMGP
jgi:hypothetical protein